MMLKTFGICAICREDLNGYYEADHIKPIWEFNRNDDDVVKKANAPENWRPLCKKCHKEVTIKAASERAEVYKLAGRTGQAARRKKKGSQFKSGQKLESKPFGDSGSSFVKAKSKWGSQKMKSKNNWGKQNGFNKREWGE